MRVIITLNREEVAKLLDMIDTTKFTAICIKFKPPISPEDLTEVIT